MELCPEQEQHAGQDASLWINPSAWFAGKNLSRGYWVFFTAAFFYDAGLSIYVFLFNLFLLDLGFNERAMGWIGGAMTLGTLVETLPAGAVSRRIGLRPLLVVLFLTAPVLCVLRTLWLWGPAQIVLAFLAGLTMCIWFVCFMPAVARLTTEKNRTTGFSLIFSVGIYSAWSCLRRMQSPPRGGRGLKYHRRNRLSRERGHGLKPQQRARNRQPLTVAPRAGAWIETMLTSRASLNPSSPRMGAWIETTEPLPRQRVSAVAPHAGCVD